MTITSKPAFSERFHRGLGSESPSATRWTLVLSSVFSVVLSLVGPALMSARGQSSPEVTTTVQDNPISLAPFGPSLIPAGQLPLGPGDLVDVNVFNTPELSGRLRVDQTGRLDLPVGGYIVVDGLTPLQAGAAIEKKLRDGQIMLDPHVSVQAFQYVTQGISVLGEVRSPGPYPLYGPHTLYDALALAGGPTANEGSTITITHHSDRTHPSTVPVNTPDFSQVLNNTPVYPGDVVFVNPADFVYVVGDVTSPGPIAIAQGRDLTLLQVIGLCHGWTVTADVNKAIIIRKTTNGTVAIPLDINAVMKNKAPDVALQASDTLVMPHSAFKKFLTYALPSATGAGFSAAEVSVTR